jgi:hypothetical protein
MVYLFYFIVYIHLLLIHTSHIIGVELQKCFINGVFILFYCRH